MADTGYDFQRLSIIADSVLTSESEEPTPSKEGVGFFDPSFLYRALLLYRNTL